MNEDISSNEIIGARARRFKRSLAVALPIFSLAVIIVIFWWLKLTGITLAGDAFCGINEHMHSDACYKKTLVCELYSGGTTASESIVAEQTAITVTEKTETVTSAESGPVTSTAETSADVTDQITVAETHVHTDECYRTEFICGFDEHVHDSSCYSDITADLEISDDWEATLATVPAGKDTPNTIVDVAKSQLGYTESERNFIVDSDGVRRGYTRYGEWYGNPYGDWSVMFTSFCLRYAGLEDVPISAGAENMRIAWNDAGLYTPNADYTPQKGDVVFLDKNGNGVADATAIVTTLSDGAVYTIEGDVENAVHETAYMLSDSAVVGFGKSVPERDPIIMYAPGDNKAPTAHLYFDGTNGNLMSLNNAGEIKGSYEVGTTIKLPETCTSPQDYSYTLHGWYDLVYNQYYKAGAEYTVQGNTVFYADWWAQTYDVGMYNEHVSDTVSTKSFITANMFDYNTLFNLMAVKPTLTINADTHDETWEMISGGKVPYKNSDSLEFVFGDWDSYQGGGYITFPADRGPENSAQMETTVNVWPDIYTPELGEILFATDNSYDPDTREGIIGKKYIGSGDYLFHYDNDPNSANHGYYYYDARRNAASYNQTDGRFYVYDYLERSTDSANNEGIGQYSDFLPFNSPYANTNGQDVVTYAYAGDNGEYEGVTHYQYDAKRDGDGSNVGNVNSNFWFGMSLNIDFYLSNDPGEMKDGKYGNLDIYGNEMHFKFTGDDDLWVLVDGKLVLDVGGVHPIQSGDINFSTGVVTVEGKTDFTSNNMPEGFGSWSTKTLQELGITEGEHTLTVYYLERGSSLSNCAIYFNISPRFQFTIQKEDVLTRDLLSGAEFTIYADRERTIPAELWTSEESYRNDDDPVNEFIITNGTVTFWGLSPGKTYYIEETKPPTVGKYSLSYGIICLSLDYVGHTTYTVEIVDGMDDFGNSMGVSVGYTVHGFRIDEETQEAFIVITNANDSVYGVTTVQAVKKWNDNKNHSEDSVTVYLTATYTDGTTKRIREVTLNDELNWTYTWTNLPKYWAVDDSEIKYTVEEAFTEGYTGKIEQVDTSDASQREWVEAYTFVDGEVYLLESANGCLSIRIGDDNNPKLYWIADRQTAKVTAGAQWTAELVNGRYVMTNGDGWTLNFHESNNGGYGNGMNGTSQHPYENIYMSFIEPENENGMRLYFTNSAGNDYYVRAVNSTYGTFDMTDNRSQGLLFTPRTPGHPADVNYNITNTPLDVSTSFKVTKDWDIGVATGVNYEKVRVTIKLYANGVDTGRTEELNLKNGWTATFLGLPYKDDDGNVIVYTIEEILSSGDWTPIYGEVKEVAGSPPAYEMTVTNKYKFGDGYELPSTGGYGPIPMVLCGFATAAGSLVYGYVLRRKRERRLK